MLAVTTLARVLARAMPYTLLMPRTKNGARSPGAPSKLDAATKKTLLDEISRGASYTDAARVAGINPATVIGWRHRGENEADGEYFQFIEDLEHARADRRRYYRDTVREESVRLMQAANAAAARAEALLREV